jgi:hypothetical protein
MVSFKAKEQDVLGRYQWYDHLHAAAIISVDFTDEWRDIIEVLAAFRFSTQDLLRPGGSKSEIAKRLDLPLRQRGWAERQFTTRTIIDRQELESRTHKIDCFKNTVALEVEWNSKDQTFDRDLASFRRLYDLQAVSAGVIVTRAEDLAPLYKQLGVQSKYGGTTTHWDKLIPRLEDGRSGGCPVLVFGITRSLCVEE